MILEISFPALSLNEGRLKELLANGISTMLLFFERY